MMMMMSLQTSGCIILKVALFALTYFLFDRNSLCFVGKYATIC